MDRKVDIHKAAGILIKERKLLVTRSRGKKHFVSPGGKIEASEMPQETLFRELKEELSIEAARKQLEFFGTFYAPAAGMADTWLQIDTFLVPAWTGEMQPSNEIEELLWIDSHPPSEIKIGSIFQHEVLPRLKAADLID